MLLGALLVLKPDTEHFGKVLSERMRSGTLDSSAADWDVDLSGRCVIGTSKRLLTRLLASDDWNSQQLLVAARIGLKNAQDKGRGVLLCCVSCVALLPQELSRPNERSWMLELPSDHVGPLIDFERQISVRVDPFGERWVHDRL